MHHFLLSHNIAVTFTQVSIDNDIDTRIQMLKSDKEEAIQMCSEASEKLNKLREEFNDAEAARDKVNVLE